MIGEMFLAVLEMSATGTVTAVLALVAGALLRKLRAPRAAVFLLWAVVAFRFLCPVTIPSDFSPLGIPALGDYAVRFRQAADGHTGDFQVAVDVPGEGSEFERVTQAGIEPVTTEFGFDAAYYEEAPDGAILPAKTSRETQLPVLGAVWLCGAALLVAWGLVSYLRLRQSLQFAVRAGEEGVWESDRIASPCVAGFLHPRIYLTFGLTGRRREQILCHERAHLRHGDHFWKLLAFLILCVHWFNPYCWMLFQNFQEELETACDLRVLQQLGEEGKEDYSESLLALSIKPRLFSACPLAFGENSIKTRIKEILRFRRPVLWVTIPASAAAVVLAVALLSDAADKEVFPASTYRVNETLYSAPEYSFGYTAATTPLFRVTDDLTLLKKEAGRERDWEVCGRLAEQRTLDGERFAGYFSGEPGFDPEQLARDDNAALGRVNVRDDPNRTFYLLLRQKDGEMLLGVGYDQPQGARLRWLFGLEAVTGDKRQTELYGQRTEYIGDNSKVGAILNALPFPDGLRPDGFELFTGAPPYGVSVRLRAAGGANTANGSASALEDPLLKNAAIFFSLVENASWVEFTREDGANEPLSFRFSRQEAEDLAGADLWRESDTLQEFLQLCDRLEHRTNAAQAPALDGSA